MFFRAKRRLILNPILYLLLHGPAMDNFQKIRISSSIPAHKTICILCGGSTRNSDSVVTVWQNEVSVFPNTRYTSGPICSGCCAKPFRKILFQNVHQSKLPMALNSWSIVMSRLLGLENPFKNGPEFITPVLRKTEDLIIDSDDDFEEMMLQIDDQLWNKLN